MNTAAPVQITDAQFRLMAPALTPAKRAELLADLNAALTKYSITTKFRAASFVANLLKESESFEYSREIWGPTPAQRRYEGRRDLGNTEPGDGKRFMGRGYIQTTGRSNYEKVGEELGLDLLNHPELLEEPKNAMLSAGFFWKSKNLNALADCLRGVRDAAEQRTLTAICRKVNGGTNGLSERVANYWRCLAVLNQAPAAVAAHKALEQRIAISPIIPTPETHTPEQIAAVQANPVAMGFADGATVGEQTKAARYIDLAEQLPPSAAAAQAKSLWSKGGSHAVEGAAWLGAALKAGEVVAWAGLGVVVLFLAYLAWRNRADLKRWKAVAIGWVKEAAFAS